MKQLLIFCLIIFNSMTTIAQNIVSCSTIPQNPNVNDSISIAVHIQFNSGGCALQSYSTSINGNSIDLTLKHCTGLLTYICDAYDTIYIGMLNSGPYQLNLDVQQWSYDFNGNCVNYIGNTQQPFNFNVDPATQLLTPALQPFTLQWSTTTKQMIATGDFQRMKLLLTDLKGSILFHEIISPGTVKLASTPASGILFYLLYDENGNKFKGKITVN